MTLVATNIRNICLRCPGQNCLELGCGAGVVGVALCRVCAALVHLTDGNATAVGNCKHNLAINFCNSTPESSMADIQGPLGADSSKQVLPFACTLPATQLL